MGVNAYTTNLGVRERQSTYVPLPFEEMYAVLQEKQKRYDLADAFEREEKRKVSMLTSPIKEFNEYYSQFKKNYLNDVTNLHNTFGGDKASSQYTRKLQDIVDTYATDPNHILIQESNQNYLKWVENATKQKSEGKYSRAANRVYENFNALNQDGTFNKFLFLGAREKINTQEALARANAMTPEDEDITSYPSGNTVVTIVGKGKKPNKMYNNMLSFLGDDGIQDYADDNNLSVDDARKQLQSVALASSNYNISTKVDPNFEAFDASLNAKRFALEKMKFKKDISDQDFQNRLALAQLKLNKEKNDLERDKLKKEIAALNGGTLNPDGTVRVPLPNLNNNVYDPNVANLIDNNGAPSGSIWSNVLNGALETLIPGLGDNQVSESPTVTPAQKTFGDMERNVRTVNKYVSPDKKLDINEVRKRYKNSVKTLTYANSFKDPKDADEAFKLITGPSASSFNFYQVNGQSNQPLSSEQSTNLRKALLAKQSDAGSAAGFALGPLPAFNTFGSQAIFIDVVGDVPGLESNPQIVAARNPVPENINDELALQEHQLNVGYAQGTPVKLPYYIDPISKKKTYGSGVEIFWKHFDDPQTSRLIRALKK